MNSGDTTDPKDEVVKKEEVSTPGVVSPTTVAASPAPETLPGAAPTEETTWYHPEQAELDPADAGRVTVPLPTEEAEDVHWTASEYIAHDKPALWYVGFVFVAVIIGALIYLLTKEIVMVVVIMVAFVLFGVMATRHPRMRDYSLDGKGVHIGEKFYPYTRFKSYSLAAIEGHRSIDLMPMERFRPPITVYFSEEQEVMVLNKLSAILPYEERRMDSVDWLMHRLRF